MTPDAMRAALAELMDELRYAYGAIKDRKGRMVPGGAFVKDES